MSLVLRTKSAKPKAKTTVLVVKKKPKRGRSRKLMVLGVLNMFPSTKTIKMVYTAELPITASTSQSVFGATHLYSLGSLKPAGLGNHYYQGWDVMNSAYFRYKILSTETRIAVYNPPTASGGVRVGIRYLSSSSVDTIVGENVDTAYQKKWTWGGLINDSGTQSFGLIRKFKNSTLEGVSSLQYAADIDNYSTALTSDPLRSPQVEIAIANTQSGTAVSCMFRIMITSVVQFIDRRTFPISGS